MNTKTPALLGLLFVLAMQTSCTTTYYSGPKSDHFDGSRFHNQGKIVHKSRWDLLRWYWTRERGPWPEFSPLAATDTPPARVQGDTLRLSYVGHVSVLLQTRGVNILLDPHWSDRASPFTWAGPRRAHPPGIAFADLPPIDLVLISHNHYDHLDVATVERLWQRDRPRILVPLGNDTILKKAIPGIEVESRDWGEQVTVAPEVVVHFEPMLHWSARSLWDRNRALWAAFVIDTPGGPVYFVGDSGYGDGDTFRAVARKHGPLRLAILPIGDYDPRWFMQEAHMNPAETVQAWEHLGRPPALPVHYNLFQLADTAYDQPLRDLEAALRAAGAPADGFRPLAPGSFWEVEVLAERARD